MHAHTIKTKKGRERSGEGGGGDRERERESDGHTDKTAVQKFRLYPTPCLLFTHYMVWTNYPMYCIPLEPRWCNVRAVKNSVPCFSFHCQKENKRNKITRAINCWQNSEHPSLLLSPLSKKTKLPREVISGIQKLARLDDGRKAHVRTDKNTAMKWKTTRWLFFSSSFFSPVAVNLLRLI